jgi:hypothetical protein
MHDEKLLIHFFQDSLSRTMLSWYIRLDNMNLKMERSGGSFHQAI